MTYRTNLLASAILVVTLSLSLPAIAQTEEIDFGDDSSTFANDGTCDDPRFSGEGVSVFTSPLDTARDATDCRAAYEAGTALYIEAEMQTPVAATQEPEDGEIDFGDDSGDWANDGECDDPRFGGALESHQLADATDCRTAYEAGEVEYARPLMQTAKSISGTTAVHLPMTMSATIRGSAARSRPTCSPMPPIAGRRTKPVTSVSIQPPPKSPTRTASISAMIRANTPMMVSATMPGSRDRAWA